MDTLVPQSMMSVSVPPAFTCFRPRLTLFFRWNQS